MSSNWALVRNRMQNGQLNLMRRVSFIAEEVFQKNARRGSIFAAAVKQDDARAMTIGKLHLLGALNFVLGSISFVCAEGASDWLLQYRIGCAYFIAGCALYLVAMSLSRGIHDGACSAKLADGLALGNYMDLMTTTAFLFAAILGGGFVCPPLVYKITPQIIEDGMRLWLLGSLFCVVAPTRVVVFGPPPPEPSLPFSLPVSSNNRYGTIQEEGSSDSALTESSSDSDTSVEEDSVSRRRS